MRLMKRLACLFGGCKVVVLEYQDVGFVRQEHCWCETCGEHLVQFSYKGVKSNGQIRSTTATRDQRARDQGL